MMSILNYNLKRSETCPSLSGEVTDERWSREPLGDLKHGLDLIFELKEKFDKLHPLASETLIRLMVF